MFNRERFHLQQPVPEGSLYSYVTNDLPEAIEQPDYFARLRSNTNVREGDVVRVISDQGPVKYHTEFCFHKQGDGQREPLVGVKVRDWAKTELGVEEKEPAAPVVEQLMQAFRDTPRNEMREDGYPDKRKYMRRIEFTQDEWEQAVSYWAAEREKEIAEANSAAAVNG